MVDVSVIDTNVLLVANGSHACVSPQCVISCVERLQRIQTTGIVAVDAGWLMVGEYQNKTRPNQPKGVGDAFLKWLLQNQFNSKRCVRVELTQVAENCFEQFPVDQRLADFDPSDCKFVAVAAAHPDRPPILQAVDSKWLEWAPILEDNGVNVEFLCLDDVAAFRRNCGTGDG